MTGKPEARVGRGEGSGAEPAPATTRAVGKRPATAAIQRRAAAPSGMTAPPAEQREAKAAQPADDPFGFHLATAQRGGVQLRGVVQRKAMPIGGESVEELTAAAGESNAELAKAAIEQRSVSLAKHSRLVGSGYRGVSAADRYELIKILCDQGWVGPYDEDALERLWDSYGANGIAAQYEIDGGVYFQRSIAGGAHLYEIPAVKQLTKDFEADVKATARGYLDKNEAFVAAELARLGIDPVSGATRAVPAGGAPGAGGGGAGAAPGKSAGAADAGAAGGQDGGVSGGAAEGDGSPEARVKEITALVTQVKRAEQIRERLLETYVGYRMISMVEGPGQVGQHPMPAPFGPNTPPDLPPKPEDLAGGGMRPFDEVNQSYALVTAVIAGCSARSPAIYAAAARGKRDALADPATAKDTAVESLRDAHRHIRSTREKLDGGGLDWRDLQPIHEQLFSGHARGRRDWHLGLNQAVARAQLQGHEDRQFWISLGLSSLAAAAFLISELATGGLAGVLIAGGVGIGAIQAGASWQKYATMTDASKATVADDLQVISSGQADAQLITALLDTVFAGIDAAGAWRVAKAAVKARRIAGAATEAATEAAGVSSLRSLETLPSRTAKVEAIEQGIAELGAEGVVRESGKSAEQLAAMIGPETAEGKRLLALAGRNAAAAEPLAELTEASVTAALDRFGPVKTLQMGHGYDKVVKALGNDSKAARRLMQWRNEVEQQLKEYMEGGIKGTGRRGIPSNDMDMSTLGKGATEAREEARAWLGARLGVEPGEVEQLVGGQLFTDPRRMHIYDRLPADVRARIDRETNRVAIEASQNLRLRKAIEAGDRELERKVREEMAELGMKETKLARLTDADRLRLGREIDELHARMLEALERGEPAEELAGEISYRQGMLSADEGGGYLSGGGVRANVTERPGNALEPGEAAKGSSPSEAVSRMFEEQRELEGALFDLRKAGSPAEIAGAIKKVGKYGFRQSSTAEAFAAGAARLDELTAKFQGLQRLAESGKLTHALEAEVQAAVKEAEHAIDDLGRAVEDNLIDWAKEAKLATGPALDEIQRRILWNMEWKRALGFAKRRFTYAGRLIVLGLDPQVVGDDLPP